MKLTERLKALMAKVTTSANKISIELVDNRIDLDERSKYRVVTPNYEREEAPYNQEFHQFQPGDLLIYWEEINCYWYFASTNHIDYDGPIRRDHTKEWPEAYNAYHWESRLISDWIASKEQAQNLLKDVKLNKGAYLLYRIGDHMHLSVRHEETTMQQLDDGNQAEVLDSIYTVDEYWHIDYARKNLFSLLAGKFASNDIFACADELLRASVSVDDVTCAKDDLAGPASGARTVTVESGDTWNGIEVAVRKLIPEQTQVVDLTQEDGKILRFLQNMGPDKKRYCAHVMRLFGDSNSTLIVEKAVGKIKAFAKSPMYGSFYADLVPDIIHQLAQCLVHLHTPFEGKYVVHNDLHPGNILLSYFIPPHDIHIKLIDFGESVLRRVDGTKEENERASKTKHIQVRYAAVEQLEHTWSAAQATRETDVWQFGMCVWSLIMLANDDDSHERLFPDEAINAMLKDDKEKRRQTLHKYLSEGNRPSTAGFQEQFQPYAQLVTDCWREEPAERPTACQILDISQRNLQQFIDEED